MAVHQECDSDIEKIRTDLSNLREYLMDTNSKSNGWNEWAKHVLYQIKDNKASIDIFTEKLNEVLLTFHGLNQDFEVFQKEVTLKLSWRAAFYGLMGSAVPAAIALIIWWVKTH